MNTDQLMGQTKLIAGEIQEHVGRILGNLHQEAKGYELEYKGLKQKKRGDAKTAFDYLLRHQFRA